jgi:pilus assembly protein CpaB
MNSNETRTLYISLALGILAMFLIYSYSQEKQAQYDKKYGTFTTVVIAKDDIPEMATIDESKLDQVKRPSDFIQPDALTEPEEAVGQVAATPIKKGEQILKNKLLPPGPLTGVALQVAPDMRAVTIPIDEVRGVSKLIKPGDRIDIVSALSYGKGADQHMEAKTILQDVTVLATGPRIVNQVPRLFEKDPSGNYYSISLMSDTSFSAITVEVNPKDAQDLIFIVATAPAGLFVTLRNPNDRQKKDVPVATVESVLKKPLKTEISSAVRFPAGFPQRIPPLPPKVKAPPANLPKKRKGPFVEL